MLDGAGSVQSRSAAVGGLALNPDGIVINGFDAAEQQAALEGVTAAKIPMVSWHSGPKIGCDAPGRHLRQRVHRRDDRVRRGREMGTG